MYCFFLPQSLSESECESDWVWVSQRNYPKTIYQIISEELHIPNKNSEHKICTKNRWREITAKKSLQRNLYPKSQKNNYRPNRLWRDLSSKKNLKRKNTKKSLKRNHYPKLSEKNLYGRISKETFPANWEEESLPKKSEDLILTKMPSKAFFVKTLWREIRAKQISIETCIKKILDETRPPQTLWREVCTKQFSKETTTKNEQIHQKYLIKHLYQKIVEGPVKLCKILPKYIWRKVPHRTICEGELSTKQTLPKSLFQTNSKRNLYQKIFEETCLPNIVWRRLSTKKYMNKFLSLETLSNNISTKNYPNRNFY